jgi:hypothetical protein
MRRPVGPNTLTELRDVFERRSGHGVTAAGGPVSIAPRQASKS